MSELGIRVRVRVVLSDGVGARHLLVTARSADRGDVCITTRETGGSGGVSGGWRQQVGTLGLRRREETTIVRVKGC